MTNKISDFSGAKSNTWRFHVTAKFLLKIKNETTPIALVKGKQPERFSHSGIAAYQLYFDDQIDDYNIYHDDKYNGSYEYPHHASRSFFMSEIESPAHAPHLFRNPDTAVFLAEIKPA